MLRAQSRAQEAQQVWKRQEAQNLSSPRRCQDQETSSPVNSLDRRQATRLPGMVSVSGGRVVAHAVTARAKRGWNRQPAVTRVRLGGEPGMVNRSEPRWAACGTERRSASVYGCAGCANTVSASPLSTIRPAYMT